jgi:hypothetical protein
MKRKREDEEPAGREIVSLTPRLDRWKQLSALAAPELERIVIWNPTRQLYRYDLEPTNPDGSTCAPTVQRTSDSPPFLFRGFDWMYGDIQPTMRLSPESLTPGRDESDARSILLRIHDKSPSADECLTTAGELVVELSRKWRVSCDYWTNFAMGRQICTASYRTTIDTLLLRPLMDDSGLLLPLATMVLEYLPFFLRAIYINGFADEDAAENNPHVAISYDSYEGQYDEDEPDRWPPDADEQQKRAISIWLAIDNSCLDIPNLDELTHVN